MLKRRDGNIMTPYKKRALELMGMSYICIVYTVADLSLVENSLCLVLSHLKTRKQKVLCSTVIFTL